jgi:hypothetical protein
VLAVTANFVFNRWDYCQPCAPADGVLIVSVRVLEYLLSLWSTCFGLTRPSSSVIVYSPEAGALLCQFFAYVRVCEYMC